MNVIYQELRRGKYKNLYDLLQAYGRKNNQKMALIIAEMYDPNKRSLVFSQLAGRYGFKDLYEFRNTGGIWKSIQDFSLTSYLVGSYQCGIYPNIDTIHHYVDYSQLHAILAIRGKLSLLKKVTTAIDYESLVSPAYQGGNESVIDWVMSHKVGMIKPIVLNASLKHLRIGLQVAAEFGHIDLVTAMLKTKLLIKRSHVKAAISSCLSGNKKLISLLVEDCMQKIFSTEKPELQVPWIFRDCINNICKGNNDEGLIHWFVREYEIIDAFGNLNVVLFTNALKVACKSSNFRMIKPCIKYGASLSTIVGKTLGADACCGSIAMAATLRKFYPKYYQHLLPTWLQRRRYCMIYHLIQEEIIKKGMIMSVSMCPHVTRKGKVILDDHAMVMLYYKLLDDGKDCGCGMGKIRVALINNKNNKKYSNNNILSPKSKQFFARDGKLIITKRGYASLRKKFRKPLVIKVTKAIETAETIELPGVVKSSMQRLTIPPFS